MASYDTSPGASLGFHWLFGMLFIFYFYTFFLFTKEVLRPGLSKFLSKDFLRRKNYTGDIIFSLVHGKLERSRIQSTQRNDVHAHYQLRKVSYYVFACCITFIISFQAFCNYVDIIWDDNCFYCVDTSKVYKICLSRLFTLSGFCHF